MLDHRTIAVESVAEQFDPALRETIHAILGVVACSWCRKLMPRIPEDDTDPVVRALGRLCRTCYDLSESARDFLEA